MNKKNLLIGLGVILIILVILLVFLVSNNNNVKLDGEINDTINPDSNISNEPIPPNDENLMIDDPEFEEDLNELENDPIDENFEDSEIIDLE